MYGANLGYDHTFNRFSLGGLVTWSRLDFDDAYSIEEGVIDNQDRDRDGYSWQLRAGYQFRTDMQAFASYQGYSIEYKEPFDRNGYSRNGDGYTVNAGIGFTMTGKLNGDVFASYNERSYDDPRLQEISGWAGGAGLQWNPTYLTSVYGRITSSIEETTSEWSSGYFRTLYSVRVDHELKRFLQINGFLSFSDNDYQLLAGAPDYARAWDEIWRAGIGLSWFINRHARLSASYEWEELETNVPGDGYETNSIWLVLGLEY
jgi:hypothetical protein